MSAARSIVVFVPSEAGILESDVLGSHAIEHLLQNVRRFDDAQITVVAAGGAPPAVAGLPDVCMRSPAELRGMDLAHRVVVVLDARCSFSGAALTSLFARAGESANIVRVVPHRDRVSAGFGQLETLAVCLPSSSDRAGLLRQDVSDCAAGLEQLFDTAAFRKATICEAVQLDPNYPPFEIDGCEGVAELERRLLFERAVLAMRQGVRIRDPRTVYIRGELTCGANVEIEVNVILEGRVALGDAVKIGANSLVRSSTIGERSRVNPFSIIEDSTVGCDSFVGPYGRIRPGSSIGDKVQIGNYVEIKSSQIGAHGRINHHSFIGDAVVGEHVTIGAGTITCNHDGVGTNPTIIERGAYIGSGCLLIAPVRIGEGATVGAGSTISRDVPAGKLALSRSPQTTVEHWVGPRSRRIPE